MTTEAGWDGRSVKLSYDKYPDLPALLLKLLETEVNSSSLKDRSASQISAVESMFPALDIIRRAGPPSSHREEIFNSVSKNLGSKVWHVREIAARTICTLLMHSEWLPAMMGLMETSTKSTNRLHGVLMAVKFMLDRRFTLEPDSTIGKTRLFLLIKHANLGLDGLGQLASLLKSSKRWRFLESGCPEIIAAYLEVSNSIAKILLSSGNSYTASGRTDRASITDRLFPHDTYKEFLDLMQTVRRTECSVNTALACNAVVRHSAFASALREDTIGLQKAVCFAATLDTDVALAAIEIIPEAWRASTSTDALFGLTKSYMGAIKMTQCPEVRAAVIFNLAAMIDQLFGGIDSKSTEGQTNGPAKINQYPSLDLNESVRREIEGLGALLQHGTKTPSLSNAEIRISGSVMVCEYVSQKHFNRAMNTYKLRMEAWGKLLVDSGIASNVSP